MDSIRKALNRPIRYARTDIHAVAKKLRSSTVDAEQGVDGEAAMTAALGKFKCDFIAHVGRELRSPLAGILGMTELALRSRLSDEQRDCLQLMRTAANAQLGMLNDLLDYVTVRTSTLELATVQFSPRDVLDDCAETLAPAAHLKGLELIIRATPEVPEFVVGDQARLRRVLFNLVQHSIKSTTAGEVVANIAVECENQTQIALHVSVGDTGSGFSKLQVKSLLDPFEGSRSDAPIGAGLGMATSLHLIHALGGTLQIDSTLGQGTDYSFNIPLAAAPRRPAFGWAGSEMIDLNVLVVDDNATSRMQIFDTLTRRGGRPTLAASKEEAIARYGVAAASDDPFAVMIVDSDMSGGDGFDLSAELLQLHGFTVPIVMMLPSYDQRRHVALAHKCGASACIVKPIRESDLYGTLQSLMAGTHESIGCVEILGEDGAGRDGDEILLVEDNPVLQVVTSRILQKHGFRVSVASNGEEALGVLREKQFSLVLMDIMMPVMDGLCTARRIRDLELTGGRHIPIVALTAMAVEGDRERCLEAGMDFYVTKPVKSKELLDIVNCFTSRLTEAENKPIME